MSACTSCGAELLWAETETGGRMPLEVEQIIDPAPRVVAYNPASGRCHVIKQEDLFLVPSWLRGGVTLHRSHWTSCPHAVQHRVADGQLALDGIARVGTAASGDDRA